MAGFLQTYGAALLLTLAYMAIIWLVSLVKENSSIVDPLWGPGFVLLSVFYFLSTEGFLARKVLLLVLVVVWGCRLALYIMWRNWGKGEDYRYRAWRIEAGPSWWWRSFFKVSMLQGVLMWLISVPLLKAQFNETPDHLTAFDVVGALLWAIGFFFEAVGDWQLARFKADPANKGKVLRTGLWAYTRHPNYFGESTLWWGYFAIALGTPWGWATVFSPLLMTFLLVWVSGVAMLERGLRATKPKYTDYVESTSAFFPWFPRERG